MNFGKLKEYLDSVKDLYGVRCCDCIVLKDHEVLMRHMTGNYDFADTKLLTEDNLHDIFSASKVLTIVGVMTLVEQGKVDLEAELSEYLPEYRDLRVVKDFDLTDFVTNAKFLFGWPGAEAETVPARHAPKIRQLMSMTAGFSYQLASPDTLKLLQENSEAGTRDIVRSWAKDPLLYEPGTRYAYSRAIDVLGAVIEAVSGETFGEYMKHHVFEPCGANEIYYQVPEGAQGRLSALYSKNPQTGELAEATFNFARINHTFESGGGGVCCTVEDYAKVLDTLANGGVAANGNRILTPESIRKMAENQLNEQQLADFHIGEIGQVKSCYGYGLGVRTLLDPTKSKSPVGEFGWDGAAGAYVLADPENHLAIFYVQEAVESGPAFIHIHPTLRDLVYEALEA